MKSSLCFLTFQWSPKNILNRYILQKNTKKWRAVSFIYYYLISIGTYPYITQSSQFVWQSIRRERITRLIQIVNKISFVFRFGHHDCIRHLQRHQQFVNHLHQLFNNVHNHPLSPSTLLVKVSELPFLQQLPVTTLLDLVIFLFSNFKQIHVQGINHLWVTFTTIMLLICLERNNQLWAAVVAAQEFLTKINMGLTFSVLHHTNQIRDYWILKTQKRYYS